MNTDMQTRAPITRQDCAALDKSDLLSSYKTRFALPDGQVYLDGNSLGALPKSVASRMQRAIVEEWGNGLIRSWNDAGWYTAPQRVGAKIARLIGADKDEVVVCDSTSVNLFKVLAAAAGLQHGRKILLAEEGNFPTDVYVAAGAARLLGLTLRTVKPEAIEQAIAEAGADLAVVQLTEVNYKTGKVYDMARITAAAHAQGALTIWDLCHSAGALPVHLNDCAADFAVGCGYKYLNGGPGAPAYVFVAARHLPAVQNPIQGWHGHAQPFAFMHEFTPQGGIDRMLSGTAAQLSLLAFEEAISVFDDVDMAAVRKKSQGLGDLFVQLVDQELGSFGFGLASPRDCEQRGSQVSLTHKDGYPIVQALIEKGVIGDFRAPDIMRFGFAPLYIGYEDVWEAVSRLKDVMTSGVWSEPQHQVRKAVT